MASSMRNEEYEGSVEHVKCFGQNLKKIENTVSRQFVILGCDIFACRLSSSQLFSTDRTVLQSVTLLH